MARTGSSPVPAAQGVRAPWTAIPPHLRARVAELAGGGEVVEAVTQPGGFSPGPAVRVRTSTGHRAFVKAVSVEMNPDTPNMHRDEARYTARMPPHAPVPKLLGALDEDGWVVLVFEEIDGRNPDPDWDPDELRRAVAALAELAAVLTPPPLDAPPAAERLKRSFCGWSRLRAAYEEGRDDLAWLDPWARDRLGALVGLETESADLSHGTTLVNMDVRADNLLMTADRVYVVDWPWAAVGAPWIDLGFFVPSVWMHSGPERARIVTEHPLLADADPEAVTAFAAGLTGMLLERSSQPAPQGLPTLRGFQRAFGTASLEWLRTLMA
ncbi:aminoglycoside phosphotransferase family protein [Catenulispora subtropica]|uniref:Aminoglycoside phosphotransferase n=1 Tax=Catenulispora subtropica TaxID=450798 RepID=A0ABP5DH86_9ACTN